MAKVTTEMLSWRVVLVQLGVFVLVMGHVVSFVRQRDHWPFSSYPMYSQVELDTNITRYRVYGVQASTGTEFDLMTEPAYITPFDMTRLNSGLRYMESRDPDKLGDALDSLLSIYERRRLDGEHSGPPLNGMRIYSVEWEVQPTAGNTNQPIRQELVHEFIRDISTVERNSP